MACLEPEERKPAERRVLEGCPALEGFWELEGRRPVAQQPLERLLGPVQCPVLEGSLELEGQRREAVEP